MKDPDKPIIEGQVYDGVEHCGNCHYFQSDCGNCRHGWCLHNLEDKAKVEHCEGWKRRG